MEPHHWSFHHYLQDPVIGSEPGSVSWPIGSDHVDVNSLLQEAI